MLTKQIHASVGYEAHTSYRVLTWQNKCCFPQAIHSLDIHATMSWINKRSYARKLILLSLHSLRKNINCYSLLKTQIYITFTRKFLYSFVIFTKTKGHWYHVSADLPCSNLGKAEGARADLVKKEKRKALCNNLCLHKYNRETSKPNWTILLDGTSEKVYSPGQVVCLLLTCKFAKKPKEKKRPLDAKSICSSLACWPHRGNRDLFGITFMFCSYVCTYINVVQLNLFPYGVIKCLNVFYTRSLVKHYYLLQHVTA